MASILVTGPGTPTSTVTGGAQNDTPESLLRKYLPKAFKGKAWTALMAAVADGDEYVRTLAAAAYDQLFVTLASGKWLNVQGSNEGVPRPDGVGMDDESYRKFILALSNKKLTLDAVLEMLEVFYGTESIRAYVQTLNAEPYNLTVGETLKLVFDGRNEVEFTISADDYVNPAVATADEVAAAFTIQAQAQGLSAFAEGYTDYLSSRRFVRFYSGSRGVRGSVRVVGGPPAAPTELSMPGLRSATFGGQWVLTKVGKTVRITSDAPVALDWRAGDGLTLRGTWGPNAGTFIITKVYCGDTYSYVEYENEFAVEGPPLHPHLEETLAYAPTLYLLDGAMAARSKDGFRVWMPATTAVVHRTEKTAAYLPSPSFKLNIVSATVSITGGRVLITIVAPGRTFTNGEKVLLDGLMANDTGDPFNYWPGGKLNGLGVVSVGGVDTCVIDLGPALIPPPPDMGV